MSWEKVLYVCANYFTSDCLTNEGQFNAGFSQGLILKEGSIPTLVAQTSAPDEVVSLVICCFSNCFSERVSCHSVLLNLTWLWPVFTSHATRMIANRNPNVVVIKLHMKATYKAEHKLLRVFLHFSA